MTRRKLVAFIGGMTVGFIVLAIAAVALFATRTVRGREYLRGFAMSWLSGATNGKVYIGPITGSILRGFTIDSIDVRDAADSLVLTTGPVTVAYDPRDIFDRRVMLKRVTILRPRFYLTQRRDGRYNTAGLFKARGPRIGPQRAFGDYIVLDSVDIRDGLFVLRQPWSPTDSLRGVKRDSAVNYALTRTDGVAITRVRGGFERRRVFTIGELGFARVQWADPASRGRTFRMTTMRVVSSDPPVDTRSGQGDLFILGDTLTLAVSRFTLPASAGRASGRVWWGSRLPARYDVRIRSDSFAVADIAWVYRTMPTTGSGEMDLHIQSRRDPRIIDYRITGMDVRSTGSHLRGGMTFGVGGPVLQLTDVDLQASPLDFKLIEQFNGRSFPVPWAGQFTGSVKARGGPVTKFVVDELRTTFADANVPGAVTRGSAVGEVNIFSPAYAVFHGLDVTAEQVDPRTIQYLYPGFPKLGGTISGRAILDSLWLDVRFRDADITHRDGPGPPTRFTGSGRITYGDPFLAYDVNLAMQTLSFTTLARSYPSMPFRGTASGPMRLRGTVEALDVTTTLAGNAGRFGFDGHVDVYPPGFAARGRANLGNLDVPMLLARTDIPATRLNAEMQVDVVGDSLANLVGLLAADVLPSVVDSVRIRTSRFRLTFENGRVRADTIAVVTTAAVLGARGAIGLTAGVTDSLRFSLVADSLGGLRRYLPVSLASRPLEGTVDVMGVLSGHIGAMRAVGTARAADLTVGASRIATAGGTFDLTGFPSYPRGELRLTADTLLFGASLVDRVASTVSIIDSLTTRFDLSARLGASTNASLGGAVAFRPPADSVGADTTTVRIDSLAISMGDGAWRLTRPATIATVGPNVRIDSLELRNGAGGLVMVAGSLPDSGAIDARVIVDSVPLADLRRLVRTGPDLGGWLMMRLAASGTRDDPRFVGNASVSDGRVGQVRYGRLTSGIRYERQSLTTDLTLIVRDAPQLRANLALPLDLAFRPRDSRLLDSPLSGTITADSIDLGLLETILPQIGTSSGRLSINTTLAGTLKNPLLEGSLRVANGSMMLPQAGVTLNQLNGSIHLFGDSLHIDKISASSGARNQLASLDGYISRRNRDNPSFGLRFSATDFQVFNKPRVANIFIASNGLTLSGTKEQPVLAGSVIVPRADLFIRGMQQKQLEDVRIPGTEESTQLPVALKDIQLRNVNVEIGQQVWLRSYERDVNIQLSGNIEVTSHLVPRDRAGSFLGGSVQAADTGRVTRFALDGELSASRGYFTLPLGLLTRKFTVDSGRVTFTGDSELNPYLSIVASNTLRNANRESGRDVRVLLLVQGQLSDPLLTLRSADANSRLSESELISYLAFGSPSFDLGNNRAYGQMLAGAFLPSVSALLSNRLSGGSYFDTIDLQTARLDSLGGSRDVFGGTTISVGRQLGRETWLFASTSLCRLGGVFDGSSTTDLVQDVGIRLERTFPRGLSAQVAIEPASSSIYCREGKTVSPGYISTPRQIGFDFFKRWRF